jgi:acetyl esterase/lipase
MHRFRLFCMLLILSFWHYASTDQSTSLAAAPSQSETTSATYTFVSSVPYAKGIRGDLLADLYLPLSAGPHPAILYIHGGSWSSGDRSQLKRVAVCLAEAGYIGVAINYDLTPQGARFPLALMEAKAAIRWMRANALTYQIDPQRIATIGSSAGGELSAELGFTIGRKEYEQGNYLEQSSSVAAVAILNGVLDLSDLGEHADMVNGYLGGSCEKQIKACHEASPVFIVHPGAPPFFAGQGTADPIVPFRQSVLFIQKLQADRVPVTRFVADGAKHTYWANSTWFQPNIDALKQFLSQTLSAR